MPPHEAAAPDAPPPIWTRHSTWRLDAAPDELEGVADILRRLGSGGESAQDAMDGAAFRVLGGGYWEGDTAEAYHQHRGKLSGDLGGFAETARSAARALDETAAVLRSGQAKLDAERDRDRLRAMPSLPLLGMVVFFPRDEGDVSAVREAEAAARDIRAWVDTEISARIPAFRRSREAFQEITDAWQPTTVRHVNLNAGMGNRDDSTTRDKLDELAEAIAAGDADVVTLQEVLEHNLEGDGGLLERLQQETGQQWEVVAFADAIQVVPDWDPAWVPDWYPDWLAELASKQGYGNAVLVRTDGPVEAPPGPDPTQTDRDQVDLSHPVDAAVSRWAFGEAPEDRTAAVAELTIRDPDGG